MRSVQLFSALTDGCLAVFVSSAGGLLMGGAQDMLDVGLGSVLLGAGLRLAWLSYASSPLRPPGLQHVSKPMRKVVADIESARGWRGRRLDE